MAGPTYLTRSRGRWHFQIMIPARHRPAAWSRWPECSNRATIKVALDTSDKHEAARRARPLIDLWRGRLTGLDAGAAAWASTRDQLSGLGIRFDEMPPEKSVALDVVWETRRAKHRFNVAKERFVKSLTDGLGISIQSAETAATAALAESFAPEFERVAKIATLLAPYGADATLARPAGPTLDDALARWRKESEAGTASVVEAEGVARRWRELHGQIPLAKIDRKMVVAFRDAIAQLPTRLGNAESALPLPKLLSDYAAKDAPRASSVTVNKKMAFLRAMLGTAVEAEWIGINPAAGLKRIGKGPEIRRESITLAETHTILQECEKLGEDLRWVVKLAIYTGARLGEIVQLTRADIREESGILVISVNGRDGKRIKTDSSWRDIPIHPDISDSFLIHINSKTGRIFSLPVWRDDLVKMPAKQLGRWLDKIGLNRQGIAFHSLRHGWKDRAREAGIGEEIHDALTGHSGASVGRRYGGRPPLSVLAEAVAKLRFPLVLLDK